MEYENGKYKKFEMAKKQVLELFHLRGRSLEGGKGGIQGGRELILDPFHKSDEEGEEKGSEDRGRRVM